MAVPLIAVIANAVVASSFFRKSSQKMSDLPLLAKLTLRKRDSPVRLINK
jgi:hypothetical protein